MLHRLLVGFGGVVLVVCGLLVGVGIARAQSAAETDAAADAMGGSRPAGCLGLPHHHPARASPGAGRQGDSHRRGGGGLRAGDARGPRQGPPGRRRHRRRSGRGQRLQPVLVGLRRQPDGGPADLTGGRSARRAHPSPGGRRPHSPLRRPHSRGAGGPPVVGALHHRLQLRAPDAAPAPTTTTCSCFRRPTTS